MRKKAARVHFTNFQFTTQTNLQKEISLYGYSIALYKFGNNLHASILLLTCLYHTNDVYELC